MKKMLQGLLVMTMGLVLFMNGGCKESGYNIVGEWTMTLSNTQGSYGVVSGLFSGSKSSGTFTWVQDGAEDIYKFTYTVVEDSVEIRSNMTEGNLLWVFNGKFQSKDLISGSSTVSQDGTITEGGIFTLTR